MRGQRANTGQPEKAERPVPERHHPRPGKRKKGTSGPMIQAMSPPFREGSGRRALEKGCSPRDPGPKGTAQLVRLPPCPPRAGTESMRHNPPASRRVTPTHSARKQSYAVVTATVTVHGQRFRTSSRLIFAPSLKDGYSEAMVQGKRRGSEQGSNLPTGHLLSHVQHHRLSSQKTELRRPRVCLSPKPTLRITRDRLLRDVLGGFALNRNVHKARKDGASHVDVAGRRMSPKDVHALMSGTCNSVRARGEGESRRLVNLT